MFTGSCLLLFPNTVTKTSGRPAVLCAPSPPLHVPASHTRATSMPFLQPNVPTPFPVLSPLPSPGCASPGKTDASIMSKEEADPGGQSRALLAGWRQGKQSCHVGLTVAAPAGHQAQSRVDCG